MPSTVRFSRERSLSNNSFILNAITFATIVHKLNSHIIYTGGMLIKVKFTSAWQTEHQTSTHWMDRHIDEEAEEGNKERELDAAGNEQPTV